MDVITDEDDCRMDSEALRSYNFDAIESKGCDYSCTRLFYRLSVKGLGMCMNIWYDLQVAMDPQPNIPVRI
jgi:hypothetical protein